MKDSRLAAFGSRFCALALLVLHLPVLVVLAVAVLVTQGRPLLYRGRRLGKDRAPFDIVKFRTLAQGAESDLGADMLAPWHGLETPLGAFLRDTRLDELPQLVNIVRGEMAFLGPRPLRPAMAERLERSGEDLSWRFRARPGLIAPANLYTPHGTSERLRRRMGRALSRQGDFRLVCVAALALLRRLALAGKVSCRYCGGGRRVSRHACTLPGRGGWSVAVLEDDAVRPVGSLAEINESAFVVVGGGPVPEEGLFLLGRPLRRGGRDRVRRAVCHGVLAQSGKGADGQAYHVYCHTPVSDVSDYMVNKYFLRKSLA